MIYEDGHPEITLSDWEIFRRGFSPFHFSEVIDRSQLNLPDDVVPLARGYVIASDYLLQRIGHHPGMGRPRGWRKTGHNAFSHGKLTVLGNANLWRVYGADRRGRLEMLVFNFGSTPIVTRSYQSAMRLAMHCNTNHPPASLRWIRAIPEKSYALKAIARKRQIAEAAQASNLPKLLVVACGRSV